VSAVQLLDWPQERRHLLDRYAQVYPSRGDSEKAALTPRDGLIAFSQIRLRKVDGHHDVAALNTV